MVVKIEISYVAADVAVSEAAGTTDVLAAYMTCDLSTAKVAFYNFCPAVLVSYAIDVFHV